MRELYKYVAGEWFDLREASSSLYSLEEAFPLEEGGLRSLYSELRLSVEGGVAEYKKGALLPVFPFLEALKYDSRGLEQLKTQADLLTPLLYVIFLQILVCRGAVPLLKGRQTAVEGNITDIKAIIAEVNTRLKDDPSLGQNSSVKNILMQMNIYKRELENMKKLTPNIPPEKASLFFTNFKKTFDSISESIRDNYLALLVSEKEKTGGLQAKNPLSEVDLSPIAKICTAQAEQTAKIRSTLFFAQKEGFKTREYLMDLLKKKEELLKPLSDETEALDLLASAKNGTGIGISKALGREILGILGKQIKRRDPASLT